jgi:hypothetical protein
MLISLYTYVYCSIILIVRQYSVRSSRQKKEMLMKSMKVVVAACGLALSFGPVYAHDGVSHEASSEAVQKQSTASVTVPRLQATMRDLWNGHVVATREYAFAVKVGDSTHAMRAADAVSTNAKQIAKATWKECSRIWMRLQMRRLRRSPSNSPKRLRHHE